jgi:ABC-type sugar transport system permease subunit
VPPRIRLAACTPRPFAQVRPPYPHAARPNSGPAVLIFAAFVIVPTFYTFYVSLWKWNVLNPSLSVYRGWVFMASWNAFLWPEIMTRSESVQPIEVGLASFSSANATDYSGLAAAATFTTLPLMVFFLFLQRQFIRGALSAAGSIR